MIISDAVWYVVRNNSQFGRQLDSASSSWLLGIPPPGKRGGGARTSPDHEVHFDPFPLGAAMEYRFPGNDRSPLRQGGGVPGGRAPVASETEGPLARGAAVARRQGKGPTTALR